jgi:hypothetical protein
MVDMLSPDVMTAKIERLAERSINACILADGNVSFVMRHGESVIALNVEPEEARPIADLIGRALSAPKCA